MMTFRHTHIVDADPLGRRTLCEVPSLGSLKPLSHFNGWSRFKLSSKARVFFGIIVFVGTYACSSSALAEVEEDTNQEVNKSDYSVPTLSNNIMTNLLIDNYTDEDVASYLLNLDSSHDHAEFVDRNAEEHAGRQPAFSSSTNPHGFDDPLIPGTVWSLDASTGAHLDHIAEGSGSDIYAAFGGSPEINDFWIRANFGLWANNNTGGAPVLLDTPLEFQVASCGGSSAERSNLDYCNNAKLTSDQLNDPSSKPVQSGSDTATQPASNNVPSSGDGLVSDAGPLPQIAPIMPQLQGTLSILGQCDVAASCVSVVVGALEPPIDAPALEAPALEAPALEAPSLSLPYPETPAPNPIIYVDNPGPISDLPPVFAPQPLKPIPEASTWVMTIIGFSIMAFIFGRKRRPRINPISIID
jgi:hypothetical protein